MGVSEEPEEIAAKPPGEKAGFRDRMIRDHVRDLSFVDVGALWGTRNEKISVAALAGARTLAIIDATPASHVAWAQCREHCMSLGVSGYAEHSCNLDDPLIHEKAGTFDFVYCSGIIYHCPSMFYSLQRLFALSNRYLMLASMVVPEIIENEFGTINLTGGGMLFIPGLNDTTRKIVAAYFAGKALSVMHITPAERPPEPFMWRRGIWPNYGPWWWLFPMQTLCSLVETVGFTIIDSHLEWGDRSAVLFCEK
jgi:hypothetical protein